MADETKVTHEEEEVKDASAGAASATAAPSLEITPGPLAPLPCPVDYSRPVQTRNGFPVRIIAIDFALTKPVLGVMESIGGYLGKKVTEWSYNGLFHDGIGSDCLDLINVPAALSSARGGDRG